MNARWIDISVPLKSGMVHWPSDPGVKIRNVKDMRRGDRSTVSHMSMGSHTGTHMDAPGHFILKAKTIDQMPLDAAVGPARVIDVRDPESIKVRDLKQQRVRKGERILFKTQNSRRCWKTDRFIKDFVYISREAAEFLGETRVRLVGVDYLSVGGFYAGGVDIHRALLSRGVWIIEGLNLSKAIAGRYDLVCLPIKILSGDGAPARAAIKRI